MSKKPNRTKSVPLTFYVTEADSQRIHRKAEACGVSLTKYLTDCAVGKEIIRIDALTEFTKALKAQGNNLNQLTTLANMGRITAVKGRCLNRLTMEPFLSFVLATGLILP